MKVSKSMAIFYILASTVLLFAGLCLLFAPQAALSSLHGVSSDFSTLQTRHTGLGLLLAATINLVCLLGGTQQRLLHGMTLLYLAGILFSHGNLGQVSLWWLWLPLLAYALPLLPLSPLKKALPALANGEQRGEVKWFNPNKGFGFILSDQGEEIFVHFKAVQNGGRRSLRTGTRVRFTTRMSERGEQADQVHIE